MEPDQLRSLIHEIISRELGAAAAAPVPASGDTPPAAATPAAAPVANPPTAPLEMHFHEQVLTASDLEQTEPHTVIVIPKGTLISPLVHDLLREKKLRLRLADETGKPAIAIGSDHGGFQLKEAIKGFLVEWEYPFFDFGTDSEAAVDYPEFAFKVARAVAENHYELGIMVDGAGIGSCMAANKVPGIRAAMCFNEASARNSREHNYANVLTLGGKAISPEQAKAIVQTWLGTPYGEERHGRRVRMIQEIERKYSRE